MDLLQLLGVYPYFFSVQITTKLLADRDSMNEMSKIIIDVLLGRHIDGVIGCRECLKLEGRSGHDLRIPRVALKAAIRTSFVTLSWVRIRTGTHHNERTQP